MHKVALLIVGLAATPAVTQAQVCTGQAPWSAGPIKLGGSLEFGDGYTNFFGGVGVGRDGGLFGGGGIGITDFTGGSQAYLSGGIGTALSVEGPVALCPIGTLVIGLPKDEVSYQTLLGGLSGGYPVDINSESVAVIIAGSLQLGFNRLSVLGQSDTDFVGLLDGGAGFILNDRISLTPRLRLGFGGGGSDFALLLGANVAIRGS